MLRFFDRIQDSLHAQLEFVMPAKAGIQIRFQLDSNNTRHSVDPLIDIKAAVVQ
jgi:hypothetical protein